MLIEKTKYTYADVAIVPAHKSYISSRKECDARREGFLPIFAAPMTSVVGPKNFNEFLDSGIQPILPRTEPLADRINKSIGGFWAAYSLQEFIDAFDKVELLLNEFGKTTKVLIDVANGHMIRLYDAVRKVRERYGDKIEIMVGNIANPETYLIAAKAGVDYVRCGVGSGGGCFVEGTQVTMADGTTRNIEDIDKGDFVLTINGPQKVTNTFIKDKQDTITINDNIECTLDHKFFVVRKTDITEGMTDEEIKEKGFYLEAQYLCEDYLLVMV